MDSFKSILKGATLKKKTNPLTLVCEREMKLW